MVKLASRTLFVVNIIISKRSLNAGAFQAGRKGEGSIADYLPLYALPLIVLYASYIGKPLQMEFGLVIFSKN